MYLRSHSCERDVFYRDFETIIITDNFGRYAVYFCIKCMICYTNHGLNLFSTIVELRKRYFYAAAKKDLFTSTVFFSNLLDKVVIGIIGHVVVQLKMELGEINFFAAAEKFKLFLAHLDVLKWARINGCKWSSWTCNWAAKSGHLDVLKWARENGC